MNRIIGYVTLAAMACLTGCAQNRELVRLRPGEAFDTNRIDLSKQSLIVELKAGEVLPLDIQINGDVVGSPPGASVPLTVKRDCCLRIDDRGLRISYDGVNFDAKSRVPGTFQLGVGVTPAGKRATLRLTTPTY